MLRIFPSFIFLIVCGVFGAAAQSAADNFRDDDQFWNETQLIVWSNEKNEFAVNGGLRIGRDFSFLVDRRVGFSYSHKPSKYLTVTGGYLYRGVFPAENRRTFENRLYGSFTLNAPPSNKFKLTDRNQVEYRAFNSRPDFWVYRNRLRLERDAKFGKTKITPFASAEIFYLENSGWYRNRFAFGIGKKFSEKFSGEIFYLRQNDGITRPGNLNVIGTNLKIHL